MIIALVLFCLYIDVCGGTAVVAYYIIAETDGRAYGAGESGERGVAVTCTCSVVVRGCCCGPSAAPSPAWFVVSKRRTSTAIGQNRSLGESTRQFQSMRPAMYVQ